MADDKPIIIIKKKGGHGGHHGGAWKIAYADFVTAMMCFFLVMWLVNSAEVTTRQAIASYFRRPGIFSEGSGTPLQIGGAGILEDAFAPQKSSENKGTGRGLEQRQLAGTPVATPKVRVTVQPQLTPMVDDKEGDTTKKAGEDKSEEKDQAKDDKSGASGGEQNGGLSEEELKALAERSKIDSIASQLKASIAGSPELAKLLGIVDVKVEADGLNLEIMDTDKTSMFSSGSSQVLPDAREAFTKLAELLKPLPNKIDIVGHTDAKPFSARVGGYSNWELSADRANAARKLLELSGIEADRITSVVGRADREPKNVKDPYANSNRRITLKMRFAINKNIDLSKNPSALQNLDKITPEPIIPEMGGAAIQTAPASGASAPKKAEETTHEMPVNAEPTVPAAYRPKNLIKAKKAAEKEALPDEEDGAGQGQKPAAGESPVIGNDPFANF